MHSEDFNYCRICGYDRRWNAYELTVTPHYNTASGPDYYFWIFCRVTYGKLKRLVIYYWWSLIWWAIFSNHGIGFLNNDGWCVFHLFVVLYSQWWDVTRYICFVHKSKYRSLYLSICILCYLKTFQQEICYSINRFNIHSHFVSLTIHF